MQAAGPPEALALDARLALADAQLEANPIVDLRSGGWSTTLTLRHPGARRLIATLGLPEQEGLRELPAWLGDGSLSLVAHLAGGPGRLDRRAFDLTAATLHASGELAFDLSGATACVGSCRFGCGDAADARTATPRCPCRSAFCMAGRAMCSLVSDQLSPERALWCGRISVTLSVADDRLRLAGFRRELGSGSVSGSFAFDAAAKPPLLAVQARLSDADHHRSAGRCADRSAVGSRRCQRARLRASGYSPAVILATLDGRVTLTVRDGTVSGFDLFRLKQAVEKPDPKIGAKQRRATRCVRERPVSIGWTSARTSRTAIWCSIPAA